MPNRPITATRKLKPFSSSGWSNVRRNWPVTLSMPTAASAKPSIIETRVFEGGSLLRPTKLAKVSSCTAKNSAGPNFSANLASTGARKVMTATATSAPKKDAVKAAVSASAARPFCAIG